MIDTEEQIVESLYQKLVAYRETTCYPYHMPGHKRIPVTEVLSRTADIDISEIEGFDNLHHAEGILQSMQEQAAKAYGADESFYLVNGSTAGILAAISAALPVGGHILMARHCHKAAYHGVYLRQLKVSYLTAEVGEYDIHKPITPAQVRKALTETQGIQAVLLVSPTYEGIVSDIGAIAEVVHAFGIPLIVDEAHGAHFGFHPAWPQNSCRKGADIVIHSLHKTMPSLTQTALLHVNGELADRGRLRRFLNIYQTSSPSYVMMAGMEEAVNLAVRDGQKLFGEFLALWHRMLVCLQDCRHLKIPQAAGMDIGKLVVSVKGTNLSGQQLYNILLHTYHLQMEMAAGTYVLAMFTLADGREGYERLTQALLEIDAGCESREVRGQEGITGLPCQALSVADAWDREKELAPLKESIGRVAGDFIHLYPPGIPAIVPGEIISAGMGERILSYTREHMPVYGVEYQENGVYITVLKS